MKIHHSRHVSTWIIDAYHTGIVYDHAPGQYRYVIETRVGRSVRHLSGVSFTTEAEAVARMFRDLGKQAPAVPVRRARRTPPAWSRAGGEE